MAEQGVYAARKALTRQQRQNPRPPDFARELSKVNQRAVLAIFTWVSRRLLIFSLNRLDATIMRNLTVSAFEYLVGHSYNFFVSNFSGTLTHRVNKFARSFETLFDDLVLNLLPTVLYVGGAIVILSLHNLMLGLGLALWTLLFVTVQIILARLQQPSREKRSAEDARLTGTIADSISNHATITLFSGTKEETSRVKEVADLWKKISLRSWDLDDLSWSVLGILIIVINVGLLGGAVYYWNLGQLTLGDFLLIQAYVLGSINALIGVNRQLRHFNEALADASEMVEILNTPHEIRDLPGAKPLIVTRGEIVCKELGFAFNKTREVLKEVTLTIHPGESVALVGPSGAGKSTVTKLLLRLYDITQGSIEIDGQDISHVTQDSLRNAIGFVPQEPILFHRSLLDNIRYGRRDATDEEVIEAAKKAHCHEFITALPDGYNTFVGERGVKLSGGERQRVAIARAILKNAPILILDEATSSLDSESEALIQDALGELMRGKTVIVIAHRLSTIMKMDRIVVLEGGTIVAEGSHEELLKHKGLYHKLWSIQAGGFLVDEEELAEETKSYTIFARIWLLNGITTRF
jgi:ATP-binding cassette subfamily B protein